MNGYTNPICCRCMVQMKRGDGLNITFPLSYGAVPANDYFCPKCGHSVAVAMKIGTEVVGITRTEVLEDLHMVKSSFQSAELDIQEGEELYEKVATELRNLMIEVSQKRFQTDWYPGIEISLFEEAFDVGYGIRVKHTDPRILKKIKLLAESINGWWIGPLNWANVDGHHLGFVTIIQWFQMYENKLTWFSRRT